MRNAISTDITPGGLLMAYGPDAPRVVDVMLDHAILRGQHDEALHLDRIRRAVARALQER